MPHDIFPSTVKALINSLTGAMCERMSKIFQFTSFLHRDVSYYVNEAGLPADGFKADLCEALADCIGTGNGSGETPNPNMPAPEALTASDDAFSDKIRIDWEPVTAPAGIDAVTQYRLYRGTTTSFASAALIATIDAPTVVYDDLVSGAIDAGVNYFYWAKATNGTDVSAPSNRDQGRAASEGEIGVLDAIADLRASFGFGAAISNQIALVWTEPTGATRYDVYRGATNVFADATQIYSDVSPQATTDLGHDTSDPVFWDNVDEVVLYDIPPDVATDYFYFVVAKGDSPPSESPESNDALGRVQPPAIYNQSSETLNFGTQSTVVPGAVSKAWIILYGSGGGGAGSGSVYGGPGGGGGGIVRISLSGLTPGHAVELATLTVNDSGKAPTETDGTAGEEIELSINSVTTAIANAGQGGVYSVAGTGDGGEGGSAGASAGSPVVYEGHAGMPNDGAFGGRSGYSFGGRRIPMADGSVGGGFEGDGYVGSGAKSVPFNPALGVGGYALTGRAEIKWGT